MSTSQKKKTDLTDYFTVKPSQKKSKEKKQVEEVKQVEEEKKSGTMEEESPNQQLVSTGGFPLFSEFQDALSTWKPLLKKVVEGKQFQKTYTYCKEQYSLHTCYPPAELIFNAFKLTPLSKLKVVIVGQDPYHQPGQAMGLCFSVPKSIKTPPSLLNMYKSLSSDPEIKNFKKPSHGDLSNWAKQGVFLLNDILTVQYNTPTSHSKDSGWAQFTDEVITIINKECENIVFLLWGKPAQKKAKMVNEQKHCVLKTSHPSPLGASAGFLTANHFSKCNNYLKKVGKEEINWNLD